MSLLEPEYDPRGRHYRNRAEEMVLKVEECQASIAAYAQGVARSYGKDGSSSVISQQLAKDIAFMDTVSDRNRYIQLAIMYSNMALLHRG